MWFVRTDSNMNARGVYIPCPLDYKLDLLKTKGLGSANDAWNKATFFFIINAHVKEACACHAYLDNNWSGQV